MAKNYVTSKEFLQYEGLKTVQEIICGGTVSFTGIATATTSNVLYYDSTTKAVTYGAAPSGGSGISGLTAGRVPVAASATTLVDYGELVWDNTNHRLQVSSSTFVSDVGFYAVNNNTAADSTAAMKLQTEVGYSTLFMTNNTGTNPALAGMYTQATNGFAFLNSGGTKIWQVKQDGSVLMPLLGTATTANVLYYDTTSKALTYGAVPAGGAPGGTSGTIQYNNAGAFGGFGSWDGTTMSITGVIQVSNSIVLPNLGAFPGASPASGVKLYCDNLNSISWLASNGRNTGFIASSNTANRWYTLPDSSGTVILDSLAQTLTNKRISPRVTNPAAAATYTPDADNFDQYNMIPNAASLTVNNPSGTPVAGQKLLLRFKPSTGVTSITWGAGYRVIGTTLPTAFTSGKITYVGCVYNSTDSLWDVIAVTSQA